MNDQNMTDKINLVYARMHIFNAIARRVSRGEMDIDEAMLWRGALTRLIEDATSGVMPGVIHSLSREAHRAEKEKRLLNLPEEGKWHG